MGRRRLLLFTIFGQAMATLATAFTANYAQFVWAQFLTRMFGYAEEMLCFVVIAEEMAAGGARLGQRHLERHGLYRRGRGLAGVRRASMSCPMAGGRFM